MRDPGDAGAPGVAEIQRGKMSIRVMVAGLNQNALVALLDAVSTDLVLHYKGVSGANEKVTIKSAIFTNFDGPVQVPDKDTGGTLQRFAVSGEAEFGETDTFATMIVFAADAT